MEKIFKLDGYKIPISFDKNNDGKLQLSELSIWLVQNDMQYVDGKISVKIHTGVYDAPKEFDINKYSIENIKKRYPSNKYEVFSYGNNIRVYERATDILVFSLSEGNQSSAKRLYLSESGGAYIVSYYDINNKLVFSEGNVNGEYQEHFALVDFLYEDLNKKNILGLPIKSKNIDSLIQSIDKENVVGILKEYQERYNKSLISVIFSNSKISKEDKANYAKHIIENLCSNIGDEDETFELKSEILKEINCEQRTVGQMDCQYIDKLINDLLSHKSLESHGLIFDIHESLSTVSTNTLNTTIQQLNSENIEEVMNQYKRLYGKSLLETVISERNLKGEARKTYVTHIVNAYLEFAETKNIKVDDLRSKFDKEIKYQIDKFGLANAKYLNVFIRQLYDRIRIAEVATSIDGYTKIKSPNGLIDEEFKQGSTGDCWLLASIKALAIRPKGLEILNKSLNVNEDGSIDVTLKGVNKTYRITQQELESNIAYASGDGDIRALEIAVNKYFEEQRGCGEGWLKKPLDINGNFMTVAYKILVGDKKIDDGETNIFEFYLNGLKTYKDITDEIINEFNNPNKVITVSSHEMGERYYIKSNSGESVTLYSNHAYAVKGSDNENVYLINPHDTTIVITVPRDEFKNFFDNYQAIDLE